MPCACAGETSPGESPAGPAPAKALDLSGSNVLLITVDTLRADRVGAYGDAVAATRRLDALAANGVRFENCHSPVPLTLPAHSTLFTGRYPFWIRDLLSGVDEELAAGFRAYLAAVAKGGGTDAEVPASRLGRTWPQLAGGFRGYLLLQRTRLAL